MLTAQIDRQGLTAPLYADGPLELRIDAVFAMPQSRHLKRGERGREHKVSKPDISNIVKIVEDAANGLLWGDDSQVVFLTAGKVTGAQSEQARVFVQVRRVEWEP
jgi:Holliday junction resolvase RusA-like endonuclease